MFSTLKRCALPVLALAMLFTWAQSASAQTISIESKTFPKSFNSDATLNVNVSPETTEWEVVPKSYPNWINYTPG